MGEEIHDQSILHEYLDEIFYLIKTASSRALATLDKSIACAMLRYLTNNLL